MKISVTKLFEFEAAHQLNNYEGECSRLHGHSYKMEVEVLGTLDYEEDINNPRGSMVIDFSHLKNIVKNSLLNHWDHETLNLTPLAPNVPTAERLAEHAFIVLSKAINNERRIVARIRIWETSSSYAEVKI